MCNAFMHIVHERMLTRSAYTQTVTVIVLYNVITNYHRLYL